MRVKRAFFREHLRLARPDVAGLDVDNKTWGPEEMDWSSAQQLLFIKIKGKNGKSEMVVVPGSNVSCFVPYAGETEVLDKRKRES